VTKRRNGVKDEVEEIGRTKEESDANDIVVGFFGPL
jgi:hypothetical protein